MGWFQPDSGQYSGYGGGNSLIVASTVAMGVEQSDNGQYCGYGGGFSLIVASTVAMGVVTVW